VGLQYTCQYKTLKPIKYIKNNLITNKWRRCHGAICYLFFLRFFSCVLFIFVHRVCGLFSAWCPLYVHTHSFLGTQSPPPHQKKCVRVDQQDQLQNTLTWLSLDTPRLITHRAVNKQHSPRTRNKTQKQTFRERTNRPHPPISDTTLLV
jgi:hypothetical protein